MTKGDEGKLTDYVVGGAAVLLLAYEAWTLLNKKKGDTISESVWRATSRRPLVPFAFGMLMGHFFFNKVEEKVAEVVENA